MIEAARLERNEAKLSELYPTFRTRIQEAYRSPAAQLAAFHSGHSKLKRGFHNITGPNGEMESLAADLLDDNNPLTPTTEYLLHLAHAAETQNLTTGIQWGLPQALQKGITEAIVDANFRAPIKVGWDPTHIEPTGLTPAQAKTGKRPG